jgi:hypothetical protein
VRATDLRRELRASLLHASHLVELLEGTSTTDEAEGGFLKDPDLLAAIDAVASFEGSVTVIVGAGASIEANLPSWPRLIRSLLETVAERQVTKEARAGWIQAVEAEGPLAAAAVAEVLAGEDFIALLRSALYTGGQARYVPQALARQVAWLKEKLGDSMTIATANFDVLLEQALREETDLQVHSYVGQRRCPAGEAAVYHLHGRLASQYPRTGRIILSEASYSMTQSRESWQDRFMSDALRDTLCLFVGLSFTDPNLIRWLYRNSSAEGPSHVAIFVRQGEPNLAPTVRPSIEAATRERWRRAHVSAVWADFYGEVAQCLHEIGLRRTRSSVADFETRVSTTYQRARSVFVPGSLRRFRNLQDELSDVLLGVLGDIRAQAEADGIELRDEKLGLALWALDHTRKKLVLWANADRRYNDSTQLLEVPLEFASEWVAVEAVTTGTVVQRDPGVYTSAWRLIRGIPIVVAESGDEGRAIVGAMTFTSRTDAAESALTDPFLWKVDALLAKVGADFFA